MNVNNTNLATAAKVLAFALTNMNKPNITLIPPPPLIECPDCGQMPERHDFRDACVNRSCRRYLINIVTECFGDHITDEQIAEVRADFMRNPDAHDE